MKKPLLVIFMGGVILSCCACGSSKITKPFSITCTGEDEVYKGFDQKSKSVYNFGIDQYITDYEVTTVSTIKDKETYNIYKESSLETVKSNDSDKIKYIYNADDKKQELTFGYSIKLSKEDLESAEDKDFYKAVNVLKRAEEGNGKCTLKGASKKQLK